MKIIILAVGKERDFAGAELVNDYLNRISHYYPVEMIYISGNDEKTENEKLQKTFEKIGDSVYSIVLDEKGKKSSSIGLSGILEKTANQSFKNLVFIIGGAYGVPQELKTNANLVLSISDMTFTHQMVRLIIAEQIYRACTIQKGEKYHHA